ncbi:MAG: hypothetical protein M9895_00335 [Aquamicrobium sp.]|uniref:hypothetical protein n=1 Tax=Aquamicrobium sp. TaxID=1872579 RepID=UPI00349F0189|nr:hypothetical protein [Aquamicrobium sp.]
MKLTKNERVCFDRAMGQWWQSLSRPDLTDEDRVKGALHAYMRQQTALDLPAGRQVLATSKGGGR